MMIEEGIYPSINKKLSHLSYNEIDELMDFYYAGENIGELLRTYKIDIDNHNLSSLFPPEVLSNNKCKYCNISMWKKRSSRTNNNHYTPYCPHCLHQEIANCQCVNCKKAVQEKREQLDKFKKENLAKTINLEKYTPVDYDAIPDLYKIYLGALIRAGLSEDLKYIIPLDSFPEKLTPSPVFDKEIIDTLYYSHVIEIFPQSNIDCFVKVTEKGSFSFYPMKVHWHINLFYDEARERFISKIMNYEKPVYDRDLLLKLWKKAALLECLEYLRYQLNVVNLLYDTGEKTEIVFSELLSNFSTGQIYGIIWHSVTNAVRFLKEKHPPVQNAAKAVITNAQRYGERALIEKWNVKNFSRIKELPQSVFSKYLYNRVLKLGDNGFALKPDINYIEINGLQDSENNG
jgi:hypothetical protein